MVDGDHLRVAGSKPQRLVAVVGLGVAGNVAGDDLGGRRSRVKMNPRLRGTARHVVRPVGGRSHVGDKLRGGACV